MNLEQILGKTLAYLVRLNPPPPKIRELVKAKCDLWVPEDVTDILAYLEAANIEPVPARGTTSERRIELTASYEEENYGRCDFSRNNYYDGGASISESELREIIEDADDVDSAVSTLDRWIEENGCFDVVDTDSERYSDHDISHSDGRENWRSDAESVILRFIDEHPELGPDRDDEEEIEVEMDEE